MFQQFSNKLLLALVAITTLVSASFAFTGTASAATLEWGHVQEIDINNFCNWDYQVLWDTSYNSVGTSSTEPDTISAKQSSGFCVIKTAGSTEVTLMKANGNILGTHVTNCNLPVGVSIVNWTQCYLNKNFTNALLNDGPTLRIRTYNGNDKTGGLIKEFTYRYK